MDATGTAVGVVVGTTVGIVTAYVAVRLLKEEDEQKLNAALDDQYNAGFHEGYGRGQKNANGLPPLAGEEPPRPIRKERKPTRLPQD